MGLAVGRATESTPVGGVTDALSCPVSFAGPKSTASRSAREGKYAPRLGLT